MRYITKYYSIEDIPVIELINAELEDKPAPLVVFYHGFTNTKDGMMTFGNEIAKRGFRVVMPDASHHGERRRKGEDLHAHGWIFFQALQSNVLEFPQIIDYYRGKDLIKDDFIGVSGMSMGGMTSSLLLKSHPSIKAGVILMGSPKQDEFNQWVIQQFISSVGQLDNLIPQVKSLVEEVANFFKKNDLGLNMEAVDHRPLLFWHSKEDPVVPYQLTEDFVEKVNQLDEGKYVYLKLDETGGHKVPYIEMSRMAEFFYAAYTEDINDVYAVSEKRFNELWG